MPVKSNFCRMFDCPIFAGKVKRSQTFANRTVKKKQEGTQMAEIVTCNKGTVDPKYIKVHDLLSKNYPADFH